MSAFARVLVAAAALGFVLPSIACAARDATPRERKAIARAAARAEGGPTLAVRTHGVRISTVGPWAAADVDIYRRGTSFVIQSALDSFVRVHGRWFDTAGAGAAHREPPRAVERDLGLAPPAPWRPPHWLHVALIVLAVLAGLYVLGWLGSFAPPGGAQAGGGPEPAPPQWSWSPPRPLDETKPRCTICDGHGRRPCYGTGCRNGTVSVPGDWHRPPTSHACDLCRGQGWIRCHCGSG